MNQDCFNGYHLAHIEILSELDEINNINELQNLLKQLHLKRRYQERVIDNINSLDIIEIDEIMIPIAKKTENGNSICPFCGREHFTKNEKGHKLQICTDTVKSISKIKTDSGFEFLQENGFYIK